MVFKFPTYNTKKTYTILIIAILFILGVCLIVQLLMPISINNNFINTAADETLLSGNAAQQNNASAKKIANLTSYRTGLFKSAVALKGKPLADKTIERIQSQLKLQCIMPMNGQLVAYIHINNVGLKKCVVGDSVNDMFTVLNIDETKKCIEISIIDHKVTLYM